MSDLRAPFLANDSGDVSIYESIEDMVAQIEPTDALDGTHEFFDASGMVLEPVRLDERWRPAVSKLGPQPERLEGVLRSYFSRLPRGLAAFSTRAAEASTLSDLVELKRELARTTMPGLRGRLFRQRWT